MLDDPRQLEAAFKACVNEAAEGSRYRPGPELDILAKALAKFLFIFAGALVEALKQPAPKRTPSPKRGKKS